MPFAQFEQPVYVAPQPRPQYVSNPAPKRQSAPQPQPQPQPRPVERPREPEVVRVSLPSPDALGITLREEWALPSPDELGIDPK